MGVIFQGDLCFYFLRIFFSSLLHRYREEVEEVEMVKKCKGLLAHSCGGGGAFQLDVANKMLVV